MLRIQALIIWAPSHKVTIIISWLHIDSRVLIILSMKSKLEDVHCALCTCTSKTARIDHALDILSFKIKSYQIHV